MQIEREDKELGLARNGGETSAATPKSAAGEAVDRALAEVNGRFPNWKPTPAMIGYARAVAAAAQKTVEEADIPSIVGRGSAGERLSASEQSAWSGYELGWRDGRGGVGARLAVLRLALLPFADACECCDEGTVDDHNAAWESPMAMAVTYGDFRRAASTLSSLAESSLSGAQRSELTRSAQDEPFSPPPSDQVGKPMPYYCPACQAIPSAGYCKLAGCPTAPSDHVGGEG